MLGLLPYRTLVCGAHRRELAPSMGLQCCHPRGVLEMLLIISGVEPNPGPTLDQVRGTKLAPAGNNVHKPRPLEIGCIQTLEFQPGSPICWSSPSSPAAAGCCSEVLSHTGTNQPCSDPTIVQSRGLKQHSAPMQQQHIMMATPPV